MITYAKHQNLFERFSNLINDQGLDVDTIAKWARFLSVAEKIDIEKIVEAMEADSTMINVLTANMDQKSGLVNKKASFEEWEALFKKEAEYIKLHNR